MEWPELARSFLTQKPSWVGGVKGQLSTGKIRQNNPLHLENRLKFTYNSVSYEFHFIIHYSFTFSYS